MNVREYATVPFGSDRTRYQENRLIVLELLEQVEAIVANCKIWQQKNATRLRGLQLIKVDTSKPAIALNDVLKLMEYTVKSKLVDVIATLSYNSSITDKPKDAVTKAGKKSNREQEREYTFFRTPEQQERWAQLQQQVTDSTPTQKLEEFLSTQVTAFTIVHVQNYLGDNSLLPDALSRELEQRGYVTYDGSLWRKPIVIEEEAIEEVTVY